MLSHAWLVVSVLSGVAGLVTVVPVSLLIWLTLKGASVSDRERLLPHLAVALQALVPWQRGRTAKDSTPGPAPPWCLPQAIVIALRNVLPYRLNPCH